MWSRLHVGWGDPPHVTSPTWGPPPSFKQTLNVSSIIFKNVTLLMDKVMAYFKINSFASYVFTVATSF